MHPVLKMHLAFKGRKTRLQKRDYLDFGVTRRILILCFRRGRSDMQIIVNDPHSRPRKRKKDYLTLGYVGNLKPKVKFLIYNIARAIAVGSKLDITLRESDDKEKIYIFKLI